MQQSQNLAKSNQTSRNMLVTSALPYANGSIHLGHLVEYIQTDIWVRSQKMLGHRVYYFCADDTHGTPIMIAAKQKGESAEKLIEKVHKEHYHDLSAFSVAFDNYYTTNSPENQQFANEIFLKLKERGHITQKEIEQAYCQHDSMFLPDRYIVGTCPKCLAVGQYGDSCDVCSATYSSLQLHDAKCSLCGNAPVRRSSNHYFFKLADFSDQLQAWYRDGGHVSSGVAKKMSEWFHEGLNDWDISRDEPYFGFKIPGEEHKYFYVWLDAPIGYMASSKNYFDSQQTPELFDQFWRHDNDWQIYHFIGKDIMYFHTLFWPAELMGAGFKTPTQVFVHGFLTVNGEKMSKSKGTFILAENYLQNLDASYLRFYYASKLTDSLDDIDLNFDDFLNKVNSDLIGNFINIFSRTGSLAKKLNLTLGLVSHDGRKLLEELLQSRDIIFDNYRYRNFAKVVRDVMALGDKVNRYIHVHEPWRLVNQDLPRASEVICDALNAGRVLATYMKPIIPDIVTKIESFLKCPALTLENIDEPLQNHQINEYQHLLSRMDSKKVAKLIENSKMSETKNTSKSSITKGEKNNSKAIVQAIETEEISIEELLKVDLRVGVIESAHDVEGSDKLLCCQVDLGSLGKRTIFAGIKGSYQTSDLSGKRCLVVANLKPRKMRFGVSEGMLMAVGQGENLSLFVPDRQAAPGDRLS